jgi:hypothetical protein
LRQPKRRGKGIRQIRAAGEILAAESSKKSEKSIKGIDETDLQKLIYFAAPSPMVT